MRKIVSFLLLCLVLTVCKVINADDISYELDDIFDNVAIIGDYRSNNQMNYYDYYLPSDMAEEEIDSDSIVLKYNNSRIIMNLNINGIINKKYYSDIPLDNDDFFVDDYLLYENEGKLDTFDGLSQRYIYKLYTYNDQYVINLITSYMNYYGSVDITDINSVTKHLLTIAKNTQVNIEYVIKDYSNIDVIDFQKKQIDLFDARIPASGELQEMLIDGAIIGNNENINENSNQNTPDNGEKRDRLEIFEE